MMISELIWDASLEELKRGYSEEPAAYTCLLCGQRIEKGIIYPEDGILYQAERYVTLHIEKAHGSVFAYLVDLDKKLTGFTDHQKNLLRLFYEGKNDTEVQEETGIGSASTIRNHRFVLKEKERQAKLVLAVMELLRDTGGIRSTACEVQPTAMPIDPIHQAKQDEREGILLEYLPAGIAGRLSKLPRKDKHRQLVFQELAKRFACNQIYDENEVNNILQEADDDYVTIRRWMVDYGFLERQPDGSRYWLAGAAGEQGGGITEERKRELKGRFKETGTMGGVYQIRNTQNGRIFVGSSTNLQGAINRDRFSLQRRSHKNKALGADWTKFGSEAFEFTVLEQLAKGTAELDNPLGTVKELEQSWIEKLQPFGERGYNG